MESKLAHDISVFGESVIKNCILNTWPKRIWGAWKVLNGEAGILIIRVNPKDMYKGD